LWLGTINDEQIHVVILKEGDDKNEELFRLKNGLNNWWKKIKISL